MNNGGHLAAAALSPLTQGRGSKHRRGRNLPPHAVSPLAQGRGSRRSIRARGKIGVIYQACGFSYVGTMTQGGRAAIMLPDGSQISERTARRIVGVGGARALARIGFDAAPVARKLRYFAFRGTRREKRELEGAIAHLVKPYPKRDSREASAPPPTISGVSPKAVEAPSNAHG